MRRSARRSARRRADPRQLDSRRRDARRARLGDGGRGGLRARGPGYGGETTYRATIDAKERCVWHFNRSDAEDASACLDAASLPGVDGAPAWPAGATWPDWLMFGDPHENFYAGEVYYDDVKLEVWQP